MANYVFGVDIGGTTVKIGLFTTQGEMVEKWEITTRTDEGGKYILSDIAASVEDKLAEKRIEKSDVAGVGMGVPGPVKADGTVIKCVNLGWGIFNVEEELSKLLALPVKAGNDANMAALGEMWQGGGKGHKDIVMVTLGTGVGGGIIVDGKIVAGAHVAGGEVGHACVDPEEEAVCNCGNRGCLETFCSTTALFARLRAAGIPVSYQDIYGSDPNEAAIAELAVAFTSGDEAVTACLQRYGMDLCCAIVSLVNLLDVRAVRLGGFPYLLGEQFAELLRSTLAEKFHILTSTGALNLQLFDCKYEDVRKAAVLQTLEAIFSRH